MTSGVNVLRWFRRDPPDRPLVEQLRDLWRVSPDWTYQPSVRVVPRWRVKTLAEWKQKHERKTA